MRPAAWYQPTDFAQKLSEEIYRAKRYLVPFSLVVIRLSLYNDATVQQFAHQVEAGLRKLDFACVLNVRSYAVGLPSTPGRQAYIVAERLRHGLMDFAPQIGVAVAPEDGITPNDLVAASEAHIGDALHRNAV